MTGWTHDDPGAGDTAALRTTAVNLDYLAAGLDQARATISAEGDVADQEQLWSGAACDTWREQRDRLVQDLGPVAEAMQAHHDALVTYADEVEDIDERAGVLRRRRTDAEQDRADARRQALTPLIAVTSSDLGPGGSAATRVAQAEAEIAAADRGLDELADRRRVADRVLVGALDPVAVGDWADLGRTLSDAGLTRPDQLSTAAVAEIIEDLLQALLAAGGSADAAALTAAHRLLADWSDSPAVMDALMERLGGAGTAALVDLLGELSGRAEIGSTALVLARALREGLARASALWDADRAAEFADGLIGSASAGGVIAFLFDDEQDVPMGVALTVATADRVDELEQRFGAGWWGTGESGASALVRASHPEDPRHGVDPGGAVLGMLAQYPDAALDWLADPDLGEARIQYWYGARGGALPLDGFRGVAALWESTFHVTGGLDDPATADLDVLSRWALTSSQIMAALGGNPAYGTATTSAAGAASVATAIGDMLPILSQVPMQEWPEDYAFDEIGFLVDSSVVFGMPVASPFVERSVLALLLGVATSQESGAAAYAAGFRDTVALNVAALDPWSSDYGEDASTMLQRVAAMLGLSQGAQVGVSITEEVRDAVVQQMYWQTATTVAGLVPVGVPGLTGAAATLAGAGVSLTQSAASSLLAPTDPIAVVSSALTMARLDEDDRIEEVRRVLGALADDLSAGYRQTTGIETDAGRMQDRVDQAVSNYDKAADSYLLKMLADGL